MRARTIDICLAPSRVIRLLVALFALLLLAHIGGLIMLYVFDHGYIFGLIPRFNFAVEGNVPTFFASSLFAAASLLFLLLSRMWEPYSEQRRLWMVLGGIFLFLAIDEFAVLHELLIEPVRRLLGTGGLLFFAWVIPYCIALLALAIWAGPKLWRLGGRFRLWFGLAAVLFLSGAVGVEMLGGRYYEANEQTVDLTYRLYRTVEESLEFTGLIVLIYTQLLLLSTRASEIRLRLLFGPRSIARDEHAADQARR